MTAILATKQDYVNAAAIAGAPLDIFCAIVLQESIRSKGFDDNGFPVCLYEPHVIWRHASMAQRQILAPHQLAYPRQGMYPYGKFSDQPVKFHACQNLTDIDLAIVGTSFGLMQILGENYKDAGYQDTNAFFLAMCHSEAEQLDAAAHLMNAKHMAGDFQTYNFQNIAAKWNGTGNVAYYSRQLEIKLHQVRLMGYK